MIYAIAAAVVIWFGVHWFYVLVMAAMARIERGTLTTYWKVMLLPAAVLGWLLDLIFNYTFAWMFLAVPKPLLFSDTVQYHYRHSVGWRWDLSAFFARNLNVFDDHIQP